MLYPKGWVKKDKEIMEEADKLSAEAIVIDAIKAFVKKPQGTSDILKEVVPLTKLNRKQCATLIKVVDLEWHSGGVVEEEIKEEVVEEEKEGQGELEIG